jgi:hypothetical protein
MKVLGKLFNRKKKLVNSPELKICIIDDTTTDLWTTFGITDQRRDEIIAFCKETYKISESKSDCYVSIVDQCKHVNEVVVATIIFERFCDVQEENPLLGLMKLFGR